MAEERVQRRLAAIMAADVVGYSRMMEADEAGTLARLIALRRELFEPTTRKHGGRIFKVTGDGALAEFKSAADAVNCAIDVQRTLSERELEVPEDRRIRLRLGVSLGDVIVKGTDLYGNGVNIAARLENLAEPGGICISENVHEHVGRTVRATFDDLGPQAVKNIDKPVKAYRVRFHGPTLSEMSAVVPEVGEKPSIAVLPFVNMSGDPEQEYFADGMADEIIMSLSRLRWLIVIARTSSFIYKGRSVDVRIIGRELGVRYVLEGSVRKSADRVRIIVQLINARTGEHLWAQRFEGNVSQVFDLQDDITSSVTGAIEPNLRSAEIELARRKRPESMDAYDYYLRALPHSYRPTSEGCIEGTKLINKALLIEPGFAPANALGAWFHFYLAAVRWSTSPEDDKEKAVKLARVAVGSGADDPYALSTAGFVLASIGGDVDAGLGAGQRAVAISPNSPGVLRQVAWIILFVGEQERVLEHIQSSLRAAPADPYAYRALTCACCACILAGRYEDAVAFGEEARRLYGGWSATHRFLAAAYAQLGQFDKMTAARANMVKLEPGMTISRLQMYLPFQVAEQAQRMWDGLRKAGVPE